MPRRRTHKLATFNVNGIGTRLPHLLAWLAREEPDVVALQELKAPDGSFPEAELEQAGYGAIWRGQRSWNGVALLGRGVMPLESRRVGELVTAETPNPEQVIADVVTSAFLL